MGDSEIETETQIEGVESSQDSWSDSEDMDYSDDSWEPNSDDEEYSSNETDPDVILADCENLDPSDVEMIVSSVDEKNNNCFAYDLEEYDDLDDWRIDDFDPNPDHGIKDEIKEQRVNCNDLESVGISGGGSCANMTSDDAQEMKNMKLGEENTEESEPMEIEESDASESSSPPK